MERVSAEYADRVKIGKIIAPDSRKLCAELRVMGLPTFLRYELGEETARKTGDDLGEKEVMELLGTS